ncbi:unnamed protein product [Rotaria sp. Silwood1]|nr:unnamed protein product [Rotaria sp. Silwood1]
MRSGKILSHTPEQQQQQAIPMTVGPSQKTQPYSMKSQYEPPTVSYNESLKNKNVLSSQVNDSQLVNQIFPNNSVTSPSSLTSANPLIPLSYASQQEQQQRINRYMDQSKTNKKNSKHQSAVSTVNEKYNNQSYAAYNQNSALPERAAKNRPNGIRSGVLQSEIDDEETKPQGKWAQWLSEPLCLGLTRLSGGLLFGSMIFLACGSIGGLITSIALYTHDSETNSQWKILGMVICSIMLTTIIATVLIFICFYKHGYMVNADDDIDPIDPLATSDFKQNDRQKNPFKTYKFISTNDASSLRSGILQDVSTPDSIPKLSFKVHDKQTNTETTIALLRLKDFNRGVWPATNAYGGMSKRSIDRPKMTSHFVQVEPHEIEETFQPPQVIYQIVPPTSAISPPQVQQRIIHMPNEQTSVIDDVETAKKQPRTTSMRETQKQNIVVQPKPRIEPIHIEEQRKQQIDNIESGDEQQYFSEYIDSSDEQPTRSEHVDTKKKRPHRIEHVNSTEEQSHRIEHVDSKEKRPHHIAQKPQYDIVEEVNERARSSSSIEDIVDVPTKHEKKHGRKKDKKKHVGKVSVKHVKPKT